MRRTLALIGVAFLVSSCGTAQAGPQYRVTLTRKDNNFYEIDGTGRYIETSRCLELSIRQDAIIEILQTGSTSGGIVHFVKSYGSPQTCTFVAS